MEAQQHDRFRLRCASAAAPCGDFNATLHAYLRRLRRDLEYNKPKGGVAKGGGGGGMTAAAGGSPGAAGSGGASGRQLDASSQ